MLYKPSHVDIYLHLLNLRYCFWYSSFKSSYQLYFFNLLVCSLCHRLYSILLCRLLTDLVIPSPHILYFWLWFRRGPGSSVAIATGCGLDGPGIESRWEARFSAPVQTVPGTHPASCTMGTGSFQGVKRGRGLTLTNSPLLVPWSRRNRAVPLLPLWAVRLVQSLSACTTVHFTFTYTSTPPVGRTACTEPQCLYNGALYLYLYFYSPYGPYGLYRASVPVQRCTLPLPIPLLPLWAVRLVQSLSACTGVHISLLFLIPQHGFLIRKLLWILSISYPPFSRIRGIIHKDEGKAHTWTGHESPEGE